MLSVWQQFLINIAKFLPSNSRNIFAIPRSTETDWSFLSLICQTWSRLNTKYMKFSFQTFGSHFPVRGYCDGRREDNKAEALANGAQDVIVVARWGSPTLTLTVRRWRWCCTAGPQENSSPLGGMPSWVNSTPYFSQGQREKWQFSLAGDY